MLSFRPSARTEPRGADLTLTGVMTDSNGVCVSFAGEVDMSTAPGFVDSVTEVLRTGSHRQVRIDLSGVRFLDSSGIRALLECRRSANADGRDLVVTGMQPTVHRVLEITGVLDLLAPTDTGGASAGTDGASAHPDGTSAASAEQQQ